MKPTPTPEQIEAFYKAHDEALELQPCENHQAVFAGLSAALSVQPASAVVGEPVAWHLERIREEISAGRKQNALAYLSFAFAEISRGQEWQLIKTAPKDKTSVIVAVPTKDFDGYIVGEAYFDRENYEGGDWWWANTSHGDYHGGPVSEINHHGPSHWKALPAPPAAGDKP
ncbi:hypothetical protein [Rhizobiales bacterium]|uniref:hypothetical protein n=1 Tax=Ensifer sp. R-19 TaxID=3404055 RepID=UPI000DDCD25B